MISHVSIGIRVVELMGRFYDPLMAMLGWERVWSSAAGIGYGPRGGGDPFAMFVYADARPPGPGFHVCFDLKSRDEVDRFYALAIARGARDDGPPGLRTNYTPTYYAGFMFDPEGWKIEAKHE